MSSTSLSYSRVEMNAYVKIENAWLLDYTCTHKQLCHFKLCMLYIEMLLSFCVRRLKIEHTFTKHIKRMC